MSAHSHRVTHLVAYRGNARDFPENTLPALRSAVELGARFLLVDVQLAADETPVVFRDVGLARIAGVEGTVFDLSARELEQIDVGDAERFGPRHRGTRMPRLDELRVLLGDRPELTAFVNLERPSLDRYGSETMITRVLDVLRPVRPQCVLVSKDLAAAHAARERAACRVGWIVPGYDLHARLKYEALRPDFLLVAAADLAGSSGRLWRGPWRWVVLDVEEPADAVAFAARGADFVATAAVARLSEELRTRARPA
jgi:glycerophosphoryl diester phosphodiesterase